MARVLLLANEAIGATAAQGTLQWVQSLADYLGEPVGLTFAESRHLEAAVRAAEDGGAGAFIDELAPTQRSAVTAVDFAWLENGRPDWNAIWLSAGDLALFGGAPARSTSAALHHVIDTRVLAEDFDAVGEVRHGIFETTGLYAEPADEGWLAVTCESTTMAAWLAAAIILENVDARFDEERLLVPASPSFALTDEVKSVVVVVAKTHHFWLEHVAGGVQAAAQVTP